MIESLPLNKQNCESDNCKYCSGEICLQCQDNYYFYNNKCYLNCSALQTKIDENKMCFNSNSLIIKNVMSTTVSNVIMIFAENV